METRATRQVSGMVLINIVSNTKIPAKKTAQISKKTGAGTLLYIGVQKTQICLDWDCTNGQICI